MNKIIRNEAGYEEALYALENLMDHDPAHGTPEADELELLTLLIQDYEFRQQYDFVPLDPIEAIKFRIDQQNLTARDLIPYMGSRSKVSEVLARKNKPPKSITYTFMPKLFSFTPLLLLLKL